MKYSRKRNGHEINRLSLDSVYIILNVKVAFTYDNIKDN